MILTVAWLTFILFMGTSISDGSVLFDPEIVATEDFTIDFTIEKVQSIEGFNVLYNYYTMQNIELKFIPELKGVGGFFVKSGDVYYLDYFNHGNKIRAISKMNTENFKKEVLTEREWIQDFIVLDEMILYSEIKGIGMEPYEEFNTVFWSMDLNGSNQEALLTLPGGAGRRWYPFQYYDGFLYYLDMENGLFCLDLCTNDVILISDIITAKDSENPSFLICFDTIFYTLSINNQLLLYQMDMAGNTHEQVTEYSVFNMMSNNESLFFTMKNGIYKMSYGIKDIQCVYNEALDFCVVGNHLYAWNDKNNLDLEREIIQIPINVFN